jgi:hypothetical protein
MRFISLHRSPLKNYSPENMSTMNRLAETARHPSRQERFLPSKHRSPREKPQQSLMVLKKAAGLSGGA